MASDELKQNGIRVFEIISLDDLIAAESLIEKEHLEKIETYRDLFRGK